jgi:hypothetical protein
VSTTDPLFCVFLATDIVLYILLYILANPLLSVFSSACGVLSVMWIQISLLSFKN